MAMVRKRARDHRASSPEALAGATQVSGPALSLRGITKRFGTTLANDDAGLDVYRGEVHAVLGENGAGKSTLVKIAYGYERADSGTVLVDGRRVSIRTPADARRLGIGMVFQSFTLIPAFTVTENLALFMPLLGPVLDRQAVAARIREVSTRYGLDVDPTALVGRLPAGAQQKVEILKLLLAGARILILDEPTGYLAPHEINGLFEMFERLRADGYAIVLIAHKLRDVLFCAQRITVMRSGRVIDTVDAGEATEELLLQLMFGSQPPQTVTAAGLPAKGNGPAPLDLSSVCTGRRHGLPLRDVSLHVQAGEILGVAGISGNGQRELADVIMGAISPVSGRRVILGQDATGWNIRTTRDHGVGFIPEDPGGTGLIWSMDAVENMALAFPGRYGRYHGLGVDRAAARRDVEHALQALAVNSPRLDMPMASLSGGNVQRMVLATQLAARPPLIVAVYPTRGLDASSAVGALRLLIQAREAGSGVVLISQDLGELFEVSDRLIVLRDGAVVAHLTPASTTPLEVGMLMTGEGSAR